MPGAEGGVWRREKMCIGPIFPPTVTQLLSITMTHDMLEGLGNISTSASLFIL